ncbi:hypothetical protein ABSA28_01174 [Candidatus Hepatincolaceae symbiont of Richtersius coronifer]
MNIIAGLVNNFDKKFKNNLKSYEVGYNLRTCKIYPKHVKVTNIRKGSLISKNNDKDLIGRCVVQILPFSSIFINNSVD